MKGKRLEMDSGIVEIVIDG